MSNVRNAKPGAGTPGFARSLCWWVATFNYVIALEGASTCLPLWPVAVDGAAGLVALLWGGPRCLSTSFRTTGLQR